MSRLLDDSQIAEIKKIIKTYHPNPAVLEQFCASKFAVIAGPAAAGKDTLRDALTDTGQYTAVLSTTTRPKRVGETDGRTYHFTSYDSLKRELSAGQHFQVALVHSQQVSGLHISEIEKLGKDRTGLSILIVQVEQKLRRLKLDLKTIFLVPPGLDEMIKRMRETRGISEAEIDRRLQAAKHELSYAISEQNYYCLITDGYEKVKKLADEFLRGGRRDESADAQARDCAEKLLQELNKK